MGGGGSVEAPTIDPRSPSKEKNTIENWYAFQQNQLNKYIENNPLMGAANAGALSNYGGLSGLTDPLQKLLSAAPGQYEGLQNQLSGLFGQGQGLFGQLGGLSGQLGNLNQQAGGLYNRLGQEANTFNPLINRTQALEGPLRGAYNGKISEVLRSGGEQTRQGRRDTAQETRQLESELGTSHTVGALGRELLRRDSARDARFQQYLGMGQSTAGTLAGLLGQEGNLRGQQAGVLGQQGGVLGLRSGLVGQQASIAGQQGGILGLLSGITQGKGSLLGQQSSNEQGLASGIQGLQTGGLNQLLGTQGANVSTFTGLQNPMLGYLGNLFGQNLQAREVDAQLQTQAAMGNQSASAGKAGGAMSSVGSIIGAVLPLLAMSDERVKQKIRDTGMKSKEGVPIKTFEYKTRPGAVMLGVLSKDVKAKVPSAVTRDPVSGVEFVDTRRFPIFEISATRKAA